MQVVMYKLEAVVVASALDYMQADSRLASCGCQSQSAPEIPTFVESQYGGRPHVVSYNIIIFVPKAGTLPHLMAFLISTFQLQQFPRYQGVPNLHQGALGPLDATQRKNFCTRSEYFTTSNCVFNFNFLAPVVSEIIGGCQIQIKGPCTPRTPPGVKILTHPSTCLCLYSCEFSPSQFH